MTLVRGLGRGPHVVVSTAVRRSIPVGLPRALAVRTRRAALRLGVRREGLAGLAIHLVGDAEMSRLHREHMQERGPTDVLSFPAAPVPGLERVTLGDIVIDVDAVKRQAAVPTPQGWLDEAVSLAVHGLVHLLGHDHKTRAEARAMARQETRAARAVGLGSLRRPYAR